MLVLQASLEIMEGRAKRQKVDKTNKFAAFQKLKELKDQGVKNKYELTADENVYEELSEKEYTKRVLKRQEDDWIDDDGGDGYVEDGREIFDDDIEDEPQGREKHGKKKKNKNIQNTAGKKGMFFITLCYAICCREATIVFKNLKYVDYLLCCISSN